MTISSNFVLIEQMVSDKKVFMGEGRQAKNRKKGG
jgi:hypothetical protein